MFRNNASVSCFTIILLFHPILPSTLQVWYLHLFLLISYFLLSERTTCIPYGNDILNTIFTGRENIKWRHEISNFTILVKNNILINGKGSPETKGLIRSEFKMWSSFFFSSTKELSISKNVEVVWSITTWTQCKSPWRKVLKCKLVYLYFVIWTKKVKTCLPSYFPSWIFMARYSWIPTFFLKKVREEGEGGAYLTL